MDNIFTWMFRPRQTTTASDPSPCVPQSSSDSTTAPSPCGFVVSLELEQRGSEASSPAEALRSSPSEEKKAKSDAGGDTKEQESEGGEDGASDKGDQNEIEKEKDHKEDDCATPINIKVKETILEEKEECGEKPRQTERKVAEAEVKGKEISKEKPEQTECKPVNAKLKVKDYSEEDSGQSKCKAAKSKAPENEEPLNLGKAEYEAVKANMKENDDSKEEPRQTEFKAANRKVKKKVKSKEEPTQTKSMGSFGGVEVERGSTGEVESGEIDVGGKQVEEEKDGRRAGEEEKAEEVQNENAIWNETEKEGNDEKEETCGGIKKGAQYPVRSDAEDCAIYMKMWTCKFGSNCKFNHPARKKVQVKETILEEKEECGEKPRQTERKVAEAEVKGKEISKEKPEQTECKPVNAKLKVKDYSEEDSGQSKCKAAKSKAPEKEDPLNLGKAEYKAVKANMKENDDSKELPGQTDFKAANRKVKKKVKSKEEPTQTKSMGLFGGVEVERGSIGEVESGEIEVGGKQVQEEKDGRRGGEEEKAEEVQNENAIWNETEKEGNDEKEETCGGLKKGAQYPMRPYAEDCAFYMKMWTCKFGSNCKFNHPARKKVQDAKQNMKEKEESKEKPGQTKCNVKKEEVSKEKSGQTKSKDAKQKMKEKEESKEKPGQTKSKVKKEEVSKEKSGQTKSKATKEKVKEKTDSTENARQFECKFYSSPEGCKFGKVCKFSHKKTNSVPPPVVLNFMGMPIRPGVKDCSSYMLTGACKEDANCKFNHPDPTPVIDEPSVQDGHGECSSSQSAQSFPVWSSQGIPNKTTPFVPMEYSATHPYTERGPYEVPVNPVPHLGQPQHDFRSKYKDRMSFHENPKAD